MNKFQQFNFINLVFENCESICIDTQAIVHMRFDEDGKRYSYERGELYYIRKLKKFYIVLDLSNSEWFWHMAGQKHFNTANMNITDDGMDCINRLKQSDDITHVYINGVGFSVPWNYNRSQFANSYQVNKETQYNRLEITVEEPKPEENNGEN